MNAKKTEGDLLYLRRWRQCCHWQACNKKVAKVTPPTPPPPPTPTATLAANPSVIQRGQSTMLTWQTTNASEITIPGLGTLPPSRLSVGHAWRIHYLHAVGKRIGRNERRFRSRHREREDC